MSFTRGLMYQADGADFAFPGHINNLYNTTFWMMVLKGGMSNTDAEQELKVHLFQFFPNLKAQVLDEEFLANIMPGNRLG